MDALDWIARVSSHVPDHHEHLLRYYGRYSNAARGKRRKKEAQRALHPTHGDHPREGDSQAERFSHQRRRSWARLLKKIYEVDSLRCPHCGSEMHIIAWIEQPEVIRKILQHLSLWERPQRSPPPRLFPHKLEAFLASLSPRQAQQIRSFRTYSCPTCSLTPLKLSSTYHAQYAARKNRSPPAFRGETLASKSKLLSLEIVLTEFNISADVKKVSLNCI